MAKKRFSATAFVKAALANSDELSPYVTTCLEQLARLSPRDLRAVFGKMLKIETKTASEAGAQAIVVQLIAKLLQVEQVEGDFKK